MDKCVKLGRKLYEERFQNGRYTVKIRFYYHAVVKLSEILEVLSGNVNIINYLLDNGSIDASMSCRYR